MSKADLSKERVIQLAHHVIQTVQCEWGDCTITLNSWDTLAKHLFRHCSRVRQRDGMYQCSHSRCSGRLHNSLAALKTHVELSHLSRMTLRCPAYSCNEAFVRAQQLQTHFEHAHRELLNGHISVDALVPLAILAPPHPLRPPPPLPHHKTPTESLLNSVSIPPAIRPGYSQASASGLSRKWSRLNVQDEESDVDLDIAFEDLPSLPVEIFTPGAVDIEIRKMLPLAGQPLLSRPQPAIHPPIRSNEPEQSILYPAFVRMVDSLTAAGSLAGHKQGVT